MADADPYDLLGVARDASQQDIQKAFRQLAKKIHPDLNPGDKDAQRKFQELSAAYAKAERVSRDQGFRRPLQLAHHRGLLGDCDRRRFSHGLWSRIPRVGKTRRLQSAGRHAERVLRHVRDSITGA